MSSNYRLAIIEMNIQLYSKNVVRFHKLFFNPSACFFLFERRIVRTKQTGLKVFTPRRFNYGDENFRLYSPTFQWKFFTFPGKRYKFRKSMHNAIDLCCSIDVKFCMVRGEWSKLRHFQTLHSGN